MQSSESSNTLTNIPVGRPCTVTQQELECWVRRAVDGEREYQKHIYEFLATRTYRVIRKIVGACHADDVMQDFMIHLFAKLGKYRFESSLETWAYRMAVNQSLQYLRKLNREEQRLQRAAMLAEASSASNKRSQEDAADMLERALENIAGEHRAILHMKEVEGMAYAAIASILEIPEGTVGSRLNKARNELRNSLIQLGWKA